MGQKFQKCCSQEETATASSLVEQVTGKQEQETVKLPEPMNRKEDKAGEDDKKKPDEQKETTPPSRLRAGDIDTSSLVVPPKVYERLVNFSDLFLEERTIMLILTPLVATLVTGTMTAIDYHTNPTPWKYLFVSQALNSIKPEPWLFFVTRYFLWHTVIINMLVFKCRHLPRRLWLLPIVTAGTNLAIIWAACRQLGNNNQRVHNRFANIYGTICVLESILLWWPNLGVVALYALVLVAGVYPKYYPFNTGIPLIYDKPDLLCEWAIILIHFVVVWHRAPKVDQELADGTYATWNWRRPFESLCMCLCCCPGVRVERIQYAQLPY